MTLGDRLVVMNNGYAAQIGSPLEVYERPANMFVAGFIGSPAMNFMEVTVQEGGQALKLPGDIQIPLNGSALPGWVGKRRSSEFGQSTWNSIRRAPARFW